MLRAADFKDVEIPVAASLGALCSVTHFCYTPYPDHLGVQQLEHLLTNMPHLRVLELRIPKFDAPLPGVGEAGQRLKVSVPLRVLRLERVPQNLVALLHYIEGAAAHHLKHVVIYDDGHWSPRAWIIPIFQQFPTVYRIYVDIFWAEVDGATSVDSPPVVTHMFSQSPEDSASACGRWLLRWQLLIHLNTLVIHEFLWPVEDDVSSHTSDEAEGQPCSSGDIVLHMLTDLEIILAAPDDYEVLDDDLVGILSSWEDVTSATMPRLERVTFSHRVRDSPECEIYVDECVCNKLLPAALYDLVELLERMLPALQHAFDGLKAAGRLHPLQKVTLRGLDIVDVDLEFQLNRLRSLARQVWLEPLRVSPTASVTDWTNYAWPNDARGSFRVWDEFEERPFVSLFDS